MLKLRVLSTTLQRKFCDKSSHFCVETLCSPKNRDKCLEKMTLATRAVTNKNVEPKISAAVLILLVRNDNEPSLLFTLRSNKLRKHVRQVSFPGGLRENGDASFVDCALRETEEEIGLSRDKVIVWGATNLLTVRNSPAIMPVIGSISNYQSNELSLNFDEVERVFTVPISELCTNRRHTQFRSVYQTDDSSVKSTAAYSVPAFVTNEERIWGITALITHLFMYSLLPTNVYQSRIPFISRYSE